MCKNGRQDSYPFMAEFSINKYFLFVSAICFPGLCRGFTENCDYLDTSRKDRTNHLECENYGCCGDFKNRHCCVGPIPIIAGVFGSLVFILIVAVIVGVCYNKYKKKQRTQVVPTITAESYNDIPLPAPPRRAPPVYNTSRLHPPPLVNHPFRHVKPAEQNHPPPSALHPPKLKSFRS